MKAGPLDLFCSGCERPKNCQMFIAFEREKIKKGGKGKCMECFREYRKANRSRTRPKGAAGEAWRGNDSLFLEGRKF